MFDPRNHSLGGTAAVITSMGLIIGLDATAAARVTVFSGLLIVGLADNLTDALAVHIYQESEGLPEPQAFRRTIANFVTRACITVSFIGMLLLTPTSMAVPACLAWGMMLLSGLSYLLARARAVSALGQIWKHGVVALGVILVSKLIGIWLMALARSP
jgi:hypothetical protein